MASEEIDPRPHKYWPSVESLKAYAPKNLQATILFVDFTKAFDSIHRGKMEQILLEYGIPKETIAAITILYRNTKVKVRSSDGDTEYFDIVAGVLTGDTLVPYLFIICIDYVLRTSINKIKENGFELSSKYCIKRKRTLLYIIKMQHKLYTKIIAKNILIHGTFQM